MKYFGYKKRDKSYIDWGGITKKISDNISETLDERENQRKEIREEHFKNLENLNDFNLTTDSSLNVEILKSAQQARDYLLNNYKLMTSGKISVDDYRTIAQNQQDGFNFYGKFIEGHQIGQKARSEAGGKLNLYVSEEVAKRTNLSQESLQPEPSTGEQYQIPKKEDGSLDVSRAIPVRALMGISSQVFDFVDVESVSKEIADGQSAGVWKTTYSNGASVSSIKLNPKYNKWLDNTIKSKTSDNGRVASILLDNAGYEIGEGENSIQVEYNNKTGKYEPVITEEQRKQAEEILKTSIEMKMGFTRTAEREATKDEKDAQSDIDKINNVVLNGDETALNSLLVKKGFVSSNSTKNGFEATDAQGNITEFNLKKGDSPTKIAKELASKLGINYNQTLEGDASEALFTDGIYKTITRGPRQTYNEKVDGPFYNRAFNVINNYGNPLTGDALQMKYKEAAAAATKYIYDTFGTEVKVITDENGNLSVDGINLGKVEDSWTAAKFSIDKNYRGKTNEGSDSNEETIPWEKNPLNPNRSE
jgi:hypothetical protein